MGRCSLRLLSWPGDDAALAWHASDGPPCAPYQRGTLYLRAHSPHHSSGTPSRQAVGRSAWLGPADRKRDRACAARPPRSTTAPSTSTTLSERLSTPLHRSHTPRIMHSVRVHHPRREPSAMAIGATDLAGCHLRTESVIVRVPHVHHAQQARQARPLRPPSGCRCRCIARTHPQPSNQNDITNLNGNRRRLSSRVVDMD